MQIYVYKIANEDIKIKFDSTGELREKNELKSKLIVRKGIELKVHNCPKERNLASKKIRHAELTNITQKNW